MSLHRHSAVTRKSVSLCGCYWHSAVLISSYFIDTSDVGVWTSVPGEIGGRIQRKDNVWQAEQTIG